MKAIEGRKYEYFTTVKQTPEGTTLYELQLGNPFTKNLYGVYATTNLQVFLDMINIVWEVCELMECPDTVVEQFTMKDWLSENELKDLKTFKEGKKPKEYR